jgi:hypothetical protein
VSDGSASQAGDGGSAASQTVWSGSLERGPGFPITASSAAGGAGGSVVSGSGNGGNGGDAVSHAEIVSEMAASNPIFSGVGRATATGGAGGQGLGGGTGGTGGDAEVFAVGSGPNLFDLSALATGGAGAESAFDGSARARASFDEAGHGSLTADARSGGGAITSLQARSAGSTPSAGPAAVETQAGVGTPAPSLFAAAGLQGAAFATGLPSQSDTQAALAGNADVAAALGAPSNALGLVVLGGGVDGDAGPTSITFTSEAAFSFDVSQLALTQSLFVGLLDSEDDGAGFDSLAFTILREGVVIAGEVFASLPAALAYFDDHVLNVGDLTTGVTGTLDLILRLSVTSDDPGAAFRTNLIVGATPIPEPATALLLVAGLGTLALRSRRRRV